MADSTYWRGRASSALYASNGALFTLARRHAGSARTLLDVGSYIPDIIKQYSWVPQKTATDTQSTANASAWAAVGIPFVRADFLRRAFPPHDLVTCTQVLEHLDDAVARRFVARLQQATAVADRTDHLAPVEAAPEPAAEDWKPEPDPEAEARRRKGLIIGLSVGAAVLVLFVVLMGTVLSNIFGDVDDGLGGDELGLNSPTESSEQTSEPQAAGQVIEPSSVTVFSPEGEADAPDLAELAIDGDPSTVWPTDTYSDPEPFPNFKNGLGLMLQLPEPATLGSVTINLNSTGTSVQIRSSSTATPSSLDDTTALTQPTALRPGSNTIDV